ncbi:cilia- and flagella-associated protein 65 [Scleropages formosus]|uniref:cilia- and flagella-associated protein 65 n=1 Tax=Scleropages formosus TaxID=113540 RepID=UPI0010FA77E4|nr:cilia- and flagella-associated protein 65 [Scleropages formosus]
MLTETPVNPLKSEPPWKTHGTQHAQTLRCSACRLPSSLPGCEGSVRWQAAELRRTGVSHRCCFLGVETREELVWETWELGREFTKTLTLKNVHSELQKLSFRPPVSTVFSTILPQTILLSPGTSFSLPVTFRPLQKHEYSDSIEFRSKAGVFQVSLRATIPCHALEVPEVISVPLCAVCDTSQTTFVFRNTSKLRTNFLWEVGLPFQLSPEAGMLNPGEECSVTVVFKPQAALVYQEEASCAFGEEGESRCSVLLQGLSKYPHLQICPLEREDGRSVLEFGSVPVGQTLEKHFDIFNPSQVSTSFRLSRVQQPDLLEAVFQCEVREGRVAPGSSVRVPVTFSPQVVDCTSVEYFSLSYPGALSRAMLKVTGTCEGPRVSLGAAVLDFGCLALGEEAMRTVELANSAAAEAYFQFDVDASGHSVFTLEPPCGILQSYACFTVLVHFRPRQPITHYRRVACLLLHREPLFLDLIGTCHTEHLRPAVLSAKHLRRYHIHRARGLTCYPPDILSTMLTENKLQLDQEGALCLSENTTTNTPMLESAELERKPMEEYFEESVGVSAGLRVHRELSGTFSGPHVSVDPPDLLFYGGSRSRPVSVTNHTKGKLSLQWTSALGSPFTISPASCELAPLKSTSFRVIYKPLQDNTLHGAQLECFASYKVLQDHYQVDSRTVCPPWCITVNVCGHSFQRGCEHFSPSLSIHRPLVVFPPLSQTSHRTVLLQNVGDLPITFSLDPEECPSVTVRPTSSLIGPGDHQILMLRSTPAEYGPGKLLLSLQLNATSKYTKELTVVSIVEKPRISIEGDGSLFLKPTAVGSCSSRSCWVKNMSRTPLQFKWRILSSDRRVLSVHPEGGILQPNETKAQMWSFTPLAEMLYTLKPSLTFWPAESPENRRSRLCISVVGSASQGSMQAECFVLDLGDILVASSQPCHLPLLNNGSCDLTFSLEVQQSIQDPDLPQDEWKDPLALELDSLTGTIPARSRMLIRCRVRPARRVRYTWSISYHTLNHRGSALTGPHALCQVQCRGVYPELRVTDAHGQGSTAGLNKRHIWRLLSLSALNAHLSRDPTPPELLYRTPTRHSLRRHPSIFTPVMLDFNFNAAPLGSDPSSVMLVLENTGSIPVEWRFLFPEDQHIELEYWAESGELSPTELHHMRVQDGRLISIMPRSGKLEPGQQRALELAYRHEFTGTYRLPVVLKLSYGREILLNFTGVTVEKDTRYIHFTSNKHIFAPVAIGGYSPPRQTYEMYNGGAVPVLYRIDTALLDQLTADNFGHPILQCLNPTGEVQPGCMALIEWIFSPLEAKTYSVDVPIHVLEGDSVLMTFEGCGFDSRALGESAPLHLHRDHPAIPSPQREALPGQLVTLSEEYISLGDIPVCSRTTRILFLTNISSTDTVVYTWNLEEQDHQEAVRIHPESGELEAGQSTTLILTLQASGNPTFYLLNLICQVTPAGSVTQYEQELQQWEQEKQRQKDEFTITEQNSQLPSPPQQHDDTLLRNGTQECATLAQKTSIALRTYKTLPPIHSMSSSLEGGPCLSPTRAERRALREAFRVWRRPESPRPALLHLGVTARSHSLLEFQSYYPTCFHAHYIQRNLQPRAPLPEARERLSHSAKTLLLSHGPEREIVTHALSAIISGVLDDPLFHQSLVESCAFPVPYFIQLRSAEPQHSDSRSYSHSPGCVESPGPGARSSSSSVQVRRAAAGPGHRRGEEPNKSAPESGQHLSELQDAWQQEQELVMREAISRLPEFCDLLEDVLLNTLQNLMMEAFHGELVLTTKPRVIAQPPPHSRRSPSRASQRSSQLIAETDRTKEANGPSRTSPSLGPQPVPSMPPSSPEQQD